MEDNLLKKLANIAIVRQHINAIINTNGINRTNINPIQKAGRELDEEFVNLLLGIATVKSVGEIIRHIAVESTTFDEAPVKAVEVNIVKNGDVDAEVIFKKPVTVPENEEAKEPSSSRPKIKTSKKAIKK